MRLSTLALAGLFGGLLLVGDASACHKKKTCACPPPAPVVACAPAPKAKHKMKMPKMTLHHKKPAATCYAPVAYPTTTVHPTMQAYPTGQATSQSM